MRLLYYRDTAGNFGDELNSWLWERLLPGQWADDDAVAMLGIGTIINAHLIARVRPRPRAWIVFGSGVGYGPLPSRTDDPSWHYVSVRGPLSARVLGLSEDRAVTDGALLLRLLADYAPLPEDQRAGIVYMPHHHGLLAGNWPAVCARAGITYLDPTADGRHIIEQLRRARLVLADAMHAAIVADAFRVPWVPIVASPESNTFKWLDWTLSMNVPYVPFAVPASSTREALRHRRFGAGDIRFAVRQPEISDVLAHYQHRVFAEDRLWRLRHAVKYGWSRALPIVEASFTLPGLSGWYSRIDERQLDASATALQAASRQPACMSRDSWLDGRIDAMAGKLDQVRRLAGHLA